MDNKNMKIIRMPSPSATIYNGRVGDAFSDIWSDALTLLGKKTSPMSLTGSPGFEAFMGKTNALPPRPWNRHYRQGHGMPVEPHQVAREDMRRYGGPVTSVYGALNGIKATLDYYIKATAPETAYLKKVLAHETGDILTFIRSLKTPTGERILGFNEQGSSEIVAAVEAMYHDGIEMLTNQIIAPLRQLRDGVVKELKGELSDKGASFGKRLGQFGTRSARRIAGLWLNDYLVNKILGGGSPSSQYEAATTEQERALREAEALSLLHGGKSSVPNRALAPDEENREKFYFGDFGAKDYGRFGNTGRWTVDDLTSFMSKGQAEKLIAALNKFQKQQQNQQKQGQQK